MILLDVLRSDPESGAHWRRMMGDDLIALRAHRDVVNLAYDLLARDQDAILKAGPTLFMPAVQAWFEFGDDTGTMGFYFQGINGSVQVGEGIFVAKRHDDDGPTIAAVNYDLAAGIIRAGYSKEMVRWAQHNGVPMPQGPADPIAANTAIHKLRGLAFTILALINSPKIVRRDPARLERLNRKRLAAGRYTFHPHHVVKLDIDRKDVRVGASNGGDGATRPLHHVRAYLRNMGGHYAIVRPHWRGDPAVGIKSTSYEIGRTNSRFTAPNMGD